MYEFLPQITYVKLKLTNVLPDPEHTGVWVRAVLSTADHIITSAYFNPELQDRER